MRHFYQLLSSQETWTRGHRSTDGRRDSALLLVQDPPRFNGQAARLFYMENTFESNVKLERREITCLAAIKGGIWCSSYTYKKSILITSDHTTLRKKSSLSRRVKNLLESKISCLLQRFLVEQLIFIEYPKRKIAHDPWELLSNNFLRRYIIRHHRCKINIPGLKLTFSPHPHIWQGS